MKTFLFQCLSAGQILEYSLDNVSQAPIETILCPDVCCSRILPRSKHPKPQIQHSCTCDCVLWWRSFMVISLAYTRPLLTYSGTVIVSPKRHTTKQVSKQSSTSPKHLKCKDFLFCINPPSNILVLGDQTKHVEEWNERRARIHTYTHTHTDPFVFINALHSLKDYLTWHVDFCLYRNGL